MAPARREGKHAQVRIGPDHPRLVAIRRPALEALDGGRGPQGEGDPPWLAAAFRLFLSRAACHNNQAVLLTTRAEGELIRTCVIDAVEEYLGQSGATSPGGRQ